MAATEDKQPVYDVESPVASGGSSTSDSALDDSYDVYKRNQDLQYDEAEAKRVLRKIDYRIVPVLFVTYMLQYLDKNGINYASVYGLKAGTHINGSQYSWLAWGIVLITTPACVNFGGIAVNRFLLGALEAAVNPGTNGIATMFGGLIGYAIGHIDSGALARWQYVFIIFGACSIAWGIVSLLVLPDLPSTAKFLTERERAIATERVAANRQGVKNTHFKKEQAIQFLRDPKTWILFVLSVGAQVPNSALTSFTSLIVKGFGFDTLGSQYLQIPGGFVQFAALLAGGFICTWWPNSRCITMIVANTICILGAALLVGLPDSNKWGRLVALWLCYFQGLGFSMSLTMISSNISGYTKKQLTGAMMFTGYCVGNIIGPQTFKDSEAPGYHSAYIAMLVGYIVKLGAVIVLYIYMWGVNKKRDREQADVSPEELEREAVEAGMRDMTELDNKGFRYIL
ncbi:hypothetical protein SLS57_009942 [Botryosphaeria dothidea]